MNDGPATDPLLDPPVDPGAGAAQEIVRRIATICNQRGLHARASARFVKTAAQFEADVRVRKNGTEVSGPLDHGADDAGGGPGHGGRAERQRAAGRRSGGGAGQSDRMQVR